MGGSATLVPMRWKVPSSFVAWVASCVTGCALEPLAPEPVAEPARADLLGSVDPRIATGGVGFGVGSAYPGPAVPFGMIHPGPDTSSGNGFLEAYHCSGYYHEDNVIRGFSLTRMHGTGVPDYGTIAFMPVDGFDETRTSESGYQTAFDHARETASPGFYSVVLDSGIQVEITASARAAIFRFGFPDGSDPVVIVDPTHKLSGEVVDPAVQVDASGVVNASVHMNGDMSHRFGGMNVFATARFEPAPAAVGTWDDTGVHDGASSATGLSVGSYLRFPPGTRQVLMRVGISFVDIDGARANLQAEIPAADFDLVRASALQAWKDTVERIEVYGASARDATMLGTAVYHAHLMPTLMTDVDRAMVAPDATVVTAAGERYSDFSLWDTYRTLHPWLLLEEYELNASFAASLVKMADRCGAVPRWPLAHGDAGSMVGSPGEIVLAESAAKGVPMDEARAFELSRASALGPVSGTCGGRPEILEYRGLGYVPSDGRDGSVSVTQEYAIADHALALWAERLGRSSDAAELGRQAGFWANLFDAESGYFRPRKADGTWDTLPLPTAGGGPYVEGDAWQYLWLVPHDPEGLAQALGGRDAALERLRTFFDRSVDEQPVLNHRSYYWHGNEPDLHAAWLFAAWQSPEEAVRWVDWVVETMYGTGPDGLAGNDDGGTLSAWLLFASAGIYPIAGTDLYLVGAPRYPKMVVHRPSGDLTIVAEPDPATHRRPVAVAIDGAPVAVPYVHHADLVGARTLVFKLAQ